MENTALMFASAGGFVAIVEALLADGRVEVNMHDQVCDHFVYFLPEC